MAPLGRFGRLEGIALALLMLPVSVVVGTLAVTPIAYGFRSESPTAPSRAATVIAVWEEQGDTLCRAFPYASLFPRMDTLRLRFLLTPDDIARCNRDVASYDARRGWRLKLDENERRYEGFSFEVDGTAPSLNVTVRRFQGDAISTTTRYRVDAGGEPFDLKTRTASPGNGVFLVFGGMLGGLVWMAWAGWRLVAAWRQRQAADRSRS